MQRSLQRSVSHAASPGVPRRPGHRGGGPRARTWRQGVTIGALLTGFSRVWRFRKPGIHFRNPETKSADRCFRNPRMMSSPKTPETKAQLTDCSFAHVGRSVETTDGRRLCEEVERGSGRLPAGEEGCHGHAEVECEPAATCQRAQREQGDGEMPHRGRSWPWGGRGPRYCSLRRSRSSGVARRHCSRSRSRSSGGSWRKRSRVWADRKSTRLNSSHSQISYAVFCLKKKKKNTRNTEATSLRLNAQTNITK